MSATTHIHTRIHPIGSISLESSASYSHQGEPSALGNSLRAPEEEEAICKESKHNWGQVGGKEGRGWGGGRGEEGRKETVRERKAGEPASSLREGG